MFRKTYVSTGEAEGQIVETSEESGTAYTINGASYYPPENYETAMEQNSSLQLAVGDEGIFYLDIESNIIFLFLSHFVCLPIRRKTSYRSSFSYL